MANVSNNLTPIRQSMIHRGCDRNKDIYFMFILGKNVMFFSPQKNDFYRFPFLRVKFLPTLLRKQWNHCYSRRLMGSYSLFQWPFSIISHGKSPFFSMGKSIIEGHFSIANCWHNQRPLAAGNPPWPPWDVELWDTHRDPHQPLPLVQTGAALHQKMIDCVCLQ